VGLLLALNGDGKSLARARIAVGCAGPRPKRVEEAEGLIEGKSLDESAKLIGRAGEVAARTAEAMNDIHGAADYKEHLVQVLLKRAFQRAVEECAAGTRDRGGRHG
jgi:carbon-monoxide dehydrogenase medium subunit